MLPGAFYVISEVPDGLVDVHVDNVLVLVHSSCPTVANVVTHLAPYLAVPVPDSICCQWSSFGDNWELLRARDMARVLGCPWSDRCVRMRMQAAMHLIEREAPARSEVLLVISGTSVIILSWSCAMKFSLAKVLKSSALRKDAVTSGACAAMAATILISTTVHKSHESVWWLDSSVAIIISFGLFVLGIRTLLKNPWWRCAQQPHACYRGQHKIPDSTLSGVRCAG